MGLFLDKLKLIEYDAEHVESTLETKTHNKRDQNRLNDKNERSKKTIRTNLKFPDLSEMPPELSLQILKHLNATDLCLAACVWSSLANDNVLWLSLCKSTWGYATVYNKKNNQVNDDDDDDDEKQSKNFRLIFMHLDEATLTFNADWKKVFNDKFIKFLFSRLFYCNCFYFKGIGIFI
jgi:hypothetical protein